MNKLIILLSITITTLLFSACSSVPHSIAKEEMYSSWNGQRYKDFLIIGVYDDRTFRVSSEVSFSEEISSKGVVSSPSYNIFPDLDALSSESKVREALVNTNHDALLVISLLDDSGDFSYGDAQANRGYVYLLGGEPGAGLDLGNLIAWAASGHYSLHIELWDVKTQQAVWEVTTNSATTGSESGDLKSLAHFVVEKLREKGLI